MHCSSYNSENPEGEKFCGECGSPLILRCAACGAENPSRFKFCGKYGAALTGKAKGKGENSELSARHCLPLRGGS
jgi:adenylate cyclase